MTSSIWEVFCTNGFACCICWSIHANSWDSRKQWASATAQETKQERMFTLKTNEWIKQNFDPDGQHTINSRSFNFQPWLCQTQGSCHTHDHVGIKIWHDKDSNFKYLHGISPASLSTSCFHMQTCVMSSSHAHSNCHALANFIELPEQKSCNAEPTWFQHHSKMKTKLWDWVCVSTHSKAQMFQWMNVFMSSHIEVTASMSLPQKLRRDWQYCMQFVGQKMPSPPPSSPTDHFSQKLNKVLSSQFHQKWPCWGFLAWKIQGVEEKER